MRPTLALENHIPQHGRALVLAVLAGEIAMEKAYLYTVVTLGVVAAAFAATLLAALPVMLLWNWLIPDLFGLRAIGFWQAWGLSMLCWLLFKPNARSSSKT